MPWSQALLKESANCPGMWVATGALLGTGAGAPSSLLSLHLGVRAWGGDLRWATESAGAGLVEGISNLLVKGAK